MGQRVDGDAGYGDAGDGEKEEVLSLWAFLHHLHPALGPLHHPASYVHPALGLTFSVILCTTSRAESRCSKTFFRVSLAVDITLGLGLGLEPFLS